MKSYARLLKYAKINTQSDPNSTTFPSSDIQFNLGKILVDELIELGIDNAYLDKWGYVYAYIPSNSTKDLKTVGFVSHMDTSPDFSGKDVNPRLIFDYDGEDVLLNKDLNIIMSATEFPFLKKRKGETLIVTDGTTLLGADDKAGIAEIMTMAEYFMTNPDIEHGMIRIAFTPDEEIGQGTDHFDVENFKCDYCYTVDGGEEGCVDFENFNAASADVVINGINIHPGSAKGHMVNSLRIAFELDGMLPVNEKPEYTEKYEGFNHLNDMSGDVSETKMHYIIRNHDKELFEKQKEMFRNIETFLNNKYGQGVVNIKIEDTYYNMYEYLKDNMDVVNLAIEATKENNIKPIISPIRGGTDGASLTYKGLPCPNLGVGGYNCHGRFEFATVEAMDRCYEILVSIVKMVSKK